MTGQKVRLLLVDDEAPFREAMQRRLEKRGFEVGLAPDGEACLAMAAASAWDLIVMDVKMPGQNGIEILRQIKEQDPKQPVILLTGNAAVSDGIEGIKAGAFDYLTKPVEMDHLVRKVRQACDMKRLEMEKEAEAAFRARLEKKMVDTERLISLGTLSTGVAHEINNPLAIINEAAGLIKSILAPQTPIDPEDREALLIGVEKIEKSVKRARRITHQLLGHVKKQTNEFSPVKIAELLEETLELVKYELKTKQAKVVWELSPQADLFYSDPYQIRQVLLNVVGNAVHALSNGGTLTFVSKKTEDCFFLEISDNGTGIPKENLGRIFDPFFTTKSFDEGTGLGLFVVHKIVTGLKGEIEVESEVGKGTCFRIFLPLGERADFIK